MYIRRLYYINQSYRDPLELVNKLYKTGTTIKVKNVENKRPPMIVQPMGAHIVPPRSVRGNNPPIVVKVVSTIGMKRTSAAS